MILLKHLLCFDFENFEKWWTNILTILILQEDQQEAFDLGVRNLELKSQVESLESQVKEFKALVFQMIKKQKASAPAKVLKVQTVSNKIGQVQTISNKSGRVQKAFNKMRQVPTSFIAAPIPMASTSKHDPSDLSFLDDVYLN